MNNLKNIQNIIRRFKNAKIMVIGDLILDEFIWGDVSRISPEAPVPVVLAKSENFKLGGACNVANNISALGGYSFMVGIIGSDKRGKILIDFLKKKNINTQGIILDKVRPTTLKTRVVARQRNQQVVRIDREVSDDFSIDMLRKIVAKIKSIVKKVDAIILEDYGKGVITPFLIKEVEKIAKVYQKKVIVDPKKNHFNYYQGVTLITPNKEEIETATNIQIKDSKSLEKAADKLIQQLNCQAVLVTLGESGMFLYDNKGNKNLINSVAQEVFDVSGAGDTVVSCFSQSLVSGATLKQAAWISNIAAGIVVGKFGTEVVTAKELLSSIKGNLKQ